MNELGRRSVAGTWFSWTLPNGSILAYDQNPGPDSRSCEAGSALDYVVNAVPKARPQQAGYIMADVQIFQNAAGLPWGLSGLDDVFGTTRDQNFRWAERCLPVLARNPVKCYPQGQVKQDSYGRMWVFSGSCNGTQNLAVHPLVDFAAVHGACTANHSVGTATILFGASNGSPNGTRDGGISNTFFSGYADLLARFFGRGVDPDSSVFAATCEVDLTTAVDFRLLNYSRADNFGSKQLSSTWGSTPVNSGYGYQVKAVSNATCTMRDLSGNVMPLDQVLSTAALATGAGATWPLLAENMYYDGWFDTLYYVASQARYQNASQGHAAFADSTNELEDALGLQTAIAMSLFWGRGAMGGDYVSSAPALQAYERIRLGPGSAWGAFYLAPPVFAVGLLAWLIWVVIIRKKVVRVYNGAGSGPFESVPQEEMG
jgi:hypothetical protein